jgi:hypothetical protein
MLVRGEGNASRRGGRVPLPALLERRLLKCEKCDGWPDQISVNWLNVGVSENLAVWRLHHCGDRYQARLRSEEEIDQ